MKLKALLLVLGLALTIQVEASGKKRPPAPEPTPTVTATAVPTPTPTATAVPVRGKIKFKAVEYYSTPAQRTVIAKAEKLVNDTIQSDCFKDFMLKRKMIQTDGRTIPQVVDHLQTLTGESEVYMYYRCMRNWKCPFGTSAVAYREPPSKAIHMNSAFFYVGMPLCEWAGTMAHESAGHALGNYGHDFNWNAQRDFSVPYSMAGSSSSNGDAFTSCCKEPK